MPIKLVVAVTDRDWLDHLRHRPELPEVNFWAPSGANFRAFEPGELFLFKLHAPTNRIVGGGVFAHASGMLTFQVPDVSDQPRRELARIRAFPPNRTYDQQVC